MNGILLRVWRKLALPKGIQLAIMRLREARFLVGVSGIIFNGKQEVLLFKHSYRQTAWGLPGGYIRAREHPKEALEREILEESGLSVSADEQLKIRTDRQTSRLEVVLVGVYLTGEFRKSDEVVDYGFYAFDDLPRIPRSQLLMIRKALDIRQERPKRIRARQTRQLRNVLRDLKQSLLSS